MDGAYSAGEVLKAGKAEHEPQREAVRTTTDDKLVCAEEPLAGELKRLCVAGEGVEVAVNLA